MFLVSLSSCDNDLINSTSESTIQKSTSNTTEYNNDYNEKLYKKLFNEFKDFYSDTTYDEFIKDVDKTEYEDSINFTYLSSSIVVDLNGNFIGKSISVYDDNDILDIVFLTLLITNG